MSTTMHFPTSTSIRSDDTSALRNSIELVGRILLVVLFLLSGIGKVGAYAATAGYMASVGVPGALLPFVILIEVLGAVAIIAGWRVRVVAALMAGFTLLTGLIFHNNFGDQIQMIMASSSTGRRHQAESTAACRRAGTRRQRSPRVRERPARRGRDRTCD